MKSLGNIGFTVPKVYFCEVYQSILGYPFMVMEKIDVLSKMPNNPESLATTLSKLHNLKVEDLKVKSLRVPKDELAFAESWLTCLRRNFNLIWQYKRLRRYLSALMNYIEREAKHNSCKQYSLIHGDYHPGNVLFTKNHETKVIDWDSVEIGDPAYDVAYNYHMMQILRDSREEGIACKKNADQFVCEYSKRSNKEVRDRIEFYKAITLLKMAIEVGPWNSNPLTAYKHYGFRAIYEFPLAHFPLVERKWSKLSFSSVCEYFTEYLESFIAGV
jgi:aminoglycoside phosphotransferase (APT) family kinase protein